MISTQAYFNMRYKTQFSKQSAGANWTGDFNDLRKRGAGLTFVTKAFIWSFLLTYVILRLVGPTGAGLTFALSLWTGVVADWAARRRQDRQKLV